MIRPGRDADAPGFIELIRACWGEYPSIVFDVDAELPEVRALASHIGGHGGALWAAEADGRIVGMVATYEAAGSWTLSRMYVDAAHRGTGLGQRLLHMAEAHARANGARRMVLWSDTLFTRAHAFYERHGYVRRFGLRALHDLSDTIEAGFAKPLSGLVVEPLDVAAAESAERVLAVILQDCVAAGDSAAFLPPLLPAAARAYWHGVTRAVGQGGTHLFVAWLDGTLAGTVQLALEMPENQRHRGEVRQLLVAAPQRRSGIAQALMQAVEDAAVAAGRRLLVLDTRANGAAEQLCRARAWQEAGTIPAYELDGQGQRHARRTFYKPL